MEDAEESLVLPLLERPSLAEAFGGGEATHFNPACAAMIDRIVGPVVGEEVIDTHREVNCGGSRLDLLAITNDRRVAVELQYGHADPSHLGRLVGWYGPSVNATDQILVAESFPASLLDAVRTRRLQNLSLLRAVAGWNGDGSVGIDFELEASSSTQESGNNVKHDAHIRSLALLGDALAVHHLKDSDAKFYIRLFPAKEHSWAVVRMRSSRVVVHVGSSANTHPERIVDDLDEEWVVVGGGLFLTVSHEAVSYTVNENAVVGIAKRVAELEGSIKTAIDALIGTIEEEDE